MIQQIITRHCQNWDKGYPIWFSSIIFVILINFQQFTAVPSLPSHWHPVVAIFSNFQPFPVIPAIYSHFNPVLAISKNIQLNSAISGHFSHFQQFLYILAMPSISRHFQPYPDISILKIFNHICSFHPFLDSFNHIIHSSPFQHFQDISSHVQPFPVIQASK